VIFAVFASVGAAQKHLSAAASQTSQAQKRGKVFTWAVSAEPPLKANRILLPTFRKCPLSAKVRLKTTLRRADKILGLKNVKVIHANDSKGGLGSRLDRHTNIGKGQIGEAAFARILTDPRLRDKPFILETPEDENHDRRGDVAALQRLAILA
jgi:hypothetical protein